MAMNSSEALSEGSIHQQIINSTDSDHIRHIPVSTSEVLSETGENTSLQQQNEGITTISTMEITENIATAEAIAAVSSASEGISLGTRVITDGQTLESVESENQLTASGLQMGGGASSSPHTPIPSVTEISISALPQTQETLTIDSQENNIISTESAMVATVADTVSVLSQSQGLPLVPTNMPPWAGRLRDCEMIGDSYRGYVTNEVELDLILTLHKQHTSTCWGTRQSPSSAKPSIRLMWRSQYVPYDGIPFLNTGRRATVMECQYGPRRKGNINKKQVFHEDTGVMSVKKLHRPTCPARIYIKKVRKFPEFRIDPSLEGKNVRQAQERALTALRLAGIDTGGEERFYVQLPLPIAHEYHDVDDIPMVVPGLDGSPAQRLDPKVADKVQELVARGVTGIYTVKHCLKEYVEKELFVSQDCPPRHNKAFFPTIIDIQNHIHTAQMSLATGALLPLPPLTNLPVPTTQSKERTSRKRKSVADKQVQGSQTQHQTAQAVASIQHTENAVLTQQQDQVSEDMLQEQRQQQDYQQQFAEQLQQVQATTAQQLNTGQPQILITQNSATGRQDGQVVIVVTNNNMYAGQCDGDVPTTLSLGALQTSQLSSLASVSFEAAVSGGQTVTYLPQTLDNNIQLPTSDGYLAQPQAGSILTVLDPRVTSAPTPVLGSVTATDAVQLQMANLPSHASGASAAVINVATALAEANRVSSSQLSLQSDQGQVTAEQSEPAAKRHRAVVLDLASLVKEAVFDTQQEVGQNAQVAMGQNVNQTGDQQQTEQIQEDAQVSQLVTMETQSVAMTTSQINTAMPTVQDLRGNVETVPVTMTTLSNDNSSIAQSSNEPELILAEDAAGQKSTDFNSDTREREQRLVAITTEDQTVKLELDERGRDSRVATTPGSQDLTTMSQDVQPTLFLTEQIDQRSVNHSGVKQTDTSNEATHYVNSDNLQQDLQASFEPQLVEQQGLSESSNGVQEQMDTVGIEACESPVCSEENSKGGVTSPLTDAVTRS